MQSENNKIDEGLFAKIAGDDNEAFAQLYYASYKQLYGFLLSLTRNKEDAEDMLQNTYIKVRNGSHLYTKQGTPMGWMCRVAKNVYLDHIRKYGKITKVDFDLVENYVTDNENNVSEQLNFIRTGTCVIKKRRKNDCNYVHIYGDET